MIATSIQVATIYVLRCVRAIRYQAKSEPNVRQDLIPRVRNGEAALMHPCKHIAKHMQNIWWGWCLQTPIVE